MDLFAVNASGEPVQHAGSARQGPQNTVADAQVVLDQVELGYTDRREVDAIGVGDSDDPSPNGDIDPR